MFIKIAEKKIEFYKKLINGFSSMDIFKANCLKFSEEIFRLKREFE